MPVNNDHCKVGGCKNKRKYKEHCSKHHHQLVRHGKILEDTSREQNKYIVNGNQVIIKLGHNKETIIDVEDLPRIINIRWGFNNGYARNLYNGYMHDIIMNKNDLNKDIDHINGDGLDNRKTNLREVEKSLNSLNCKLKKNNNSGQTGVSYCNTYKKYVAYITVNHKKIFLGYHCTLEKAIKARKKYTEENGIICQ